jgi:hypothetical protein
MIKLTCPKVKYLWKDASLWLGLGIHQGSSRETWLEIDTVPTNRLVLLEHLSLWTFFIHISLSLLPSTSPKASLPHVPSLPVSRQHEHLGSFPQCQTDLRLMVCPASKMVEWGYLPSVSATPKTKSIPTSLVP